AHPQSWVDFMMRYELGLEKPDPRRALHSGLTVAVSYVAGGLIPLFPYIALHSATDALSGSVVGTAVAVFGFGAIKGRFAGGRPFRSGIRTVLIGGLAAAAAFGLARMLSP